MNLDAQPGPSEPTISEVENPAITPDFTTSGQIPEVIPSLDEASTSRRLSRRQFLKFTATTSAAFVAGIGVGFWQWGLPLASAKAPGHLDTAAAQAAVPAALALPASYRLPISYGRIGPHLISAGVLDYDAFVGVFDPEDAPLSEEQLALLREESDAPVVIDLANARFLLNLFWAVGLANNNPILRKGKMMTESDGRIESFASTGGWTLNTQPIRAIYAGSTFASLTETQQERLQEATAAIYRPCCDNATDFPDCNHGMAMLGILELLAARDATVDAMFEAAKNVNRFWFPEQTRDLALYHQAQGTTTFDDIPSRSATGIDQFSASGYDKVRGWLAANGKTDAPGNGGSNCGV